MKGIATTTVLCLVLPFAEFGAEGGSANLTIVWLDLAVPERIVWLTLTIMHAILLYTAILQNQGVAPKPFVRLWKHDPPDTPPMERRSGPGQDEMELRFYLLHVLHKVAFFYVAIAALLVAIWSTFKAFSGGC